MALPKKKSHPISIGGQSYRWMVRATPHELVLTVAHDSGGQLLQTTLNKLNLFRRNRDSHWEFVRQGRNVTPSLVRKLIETALDQDWKPLKRKSKPFTLNALVWRNENLIDPIQSISLDQWLDPPLGKRIASEFLVPVAHIAQTEAEALIHDLAWPCDFRDRVLGLKPGESLTIPVAWLSQPAQNAGLEFVATFDDVHEEYGYPQLSITCDQYNAEAGFQLTWW